MTSLSSFLCQANLCPLSGCTLCYQDNDALRMASGCVIVGPKRMMMILVSSIFPLWILDVLFTGHTTHNQTWSIHKSLDPTSNSSTMSALDEQIYRGAIALNNIGVDLLERKRAYQQALATLIDATNAMKIALRNIRLSETGGRLPQTVDISAMLERASKRCSRPTPMERQSSFRMLNLADNHNHILQGHNPLLESIYPIRIDDVSSDIYCPGSLSDPDVQAAILVYNLGLANLCLARINGVPLQENLQLHQAISLFHLSNDILERCSAELEDELTLRKSACVNMAVVSGLIQALASDERVLAERFQDLQGRLYHLRSAVDMLDQMLPCPSFVHSAAAA